MIFTGIGWAKPVPTYASRFKNPKAGMALTAAAGPVADGFFDRPNVHCQNVSAGRTKQAFVLLSQKVLANIQTALAE